jgi:hypothetical protein
VRLARPSAEPAGRLLPSDRLTRNIDMTRKRQWLVFALWFVLGGATTAGAEYVVRLRHGMLQVRNLLMGRAYVARIEEYRSNHHVYPSRLADALSQKESWLGGRDAWGTPIQYESDGKYFVLVSFGADRRREYFGDLRDLRIPAVTAGTVPFPYWHTCGDAAADLVMSDLGEHRVCGK